jgi:hypothetical protein
MPKSLFPLFLLALMSLSLTSPMPMYAWELEPMRLIRSTIPAGIIPTPVQMDEDLGGNGMPEHLILANGHLKIMVRGKIVWQSPEEWNVVQAEFTDLNRDDVMEATLLVWRPFRTWPVDQWLPHGGRIASFHNADGYSCQIILIGWGDGQYREKWAGSALADPVTSFAVADLDNDGTQELVTLENEYADPRSAPARDLKIWKWNGFGFTIVTKIDGTFSKMALVQASNGRTLILVP